MARWWWNSAADARAAVALAALAMALLAGCSGGDGDGDSPSVDGRTPVGALPTPAGASGSVTGMPTSPPRVDEPVVEAPPEPVPAPVAEGEPPSDPNAIPIDPATGLAAGAAPPAEPTPPVQPDVAGAGAVVREYVAALGAGSFAGAQQLWSATPNDAAVLQLARGPAFAADVLAPLRPADPAATGVAGVPVRVRGTAEDGSERSLSVVYTVRRAEDGQWRIASANVREATP